MFQYAALLSSIWGLGEKIESEEKILRRNDDLDLDRDDRMVASESRYSVNRIGHYIPLRHRRQRRPVPRHHQRRQRYPKPPLFQQALSRYSSRKGEASKTLSPSSKPYKPPAKKLKPPSKPYKPPSRPIKRPPPVRFTPPKKSYKPPQPGYNTYLPPPNPTPYQVRMTSVTPVSFQSGATFVSG